MKNLFKILLIVLIIGFGSCSNELDLVDPTEPIPVVCFRLDPSDSIFYLTLTRSFSGNSSGFDLARDPQKVFYENADIRLENWIGEYKVGETRFYPSNLTKNPGLFPEVPGYCYQAFNELSMMGSDVVSSMANNFRLIIDVKGKFGPANSTIPMIPLPVQTLPSTFDKRFDLYPPDSSHFTVQFKINFKFVKYCELLCIFRYQELAGSWVDHSETISLRKSMKITNDNGIYTATAIIYPDLFYNKLATNIKPINDTMIRRFRSMDLVFISGDQQYKDYTETYINAGNLDAPAMGNINNGYGLFTMTRTLRFENMILSRKTLDSLASGQYSKHLGFNKWY